MNSRVFLQGKPIDLRPDSFVAAGGQGRVFAFGDTAIKVFDDPTAVPPPDKLAALAALRGPHVAAPDHPVCDAQGETVGYTMPFFRDAVSWAKLSTPAFRRRVGLDERAAMGLVLSLGSALAEIHRHGVTVVDLSENNVLVRDTALCLIDLDSWQTARHRATALTPTIASPHVPPGEFDAATDWFAFAVLACSLLLGVHPFKGRHPQHKGLQARMRAKVSVFDPAVRIPGICRSPDSLPPSLATWFRAVLERGASGPPPLGALPSPKPRPRQASSHGYPGPIREVVATGGTPWVATATAAFVGARCWLDEGRPIRALGRSHEGAPYVLQTSAHGSLEVCVEGCSARAPVLTPFDALVSFDGQVFAQQRHRLLALDVRHIGVRPHLLTREVGRVLPLATQLFPGVALQNVLGVWHASLLGHPQGTPLCPLPNLDGHEVLDARRAGDRLVVLTGHRGATTRHVITLTARGGVASHHRESDTDRWGTVFTSIGPGVYVEVGSDGLRTVDNPARPGWTHPLPNPAAADLHHDGARLLVSAGTELLEIPGPCAPPKTGVRLGFDATRRL